MERECLNQKGIFTLAGKEADSFKYPDQDVLNILLQDKVIFLPRPYNTIYTIKSELKDKSHKKYSNIINDNTILIHYTGATKPWHARANYPSVIYYKNARLNSPRKIFPQKMRVP